jgi:hypothetical protein
VLSVSHAQAEALIDLTDEIAIANPKGFLGLSGDLQHAANAPLHTVAGGATPLLEIVEPGAWRRYDTIMAIVDAKTPISPNDLITALNDGKKALGEPYYDPDTGKKVNLPGPYALRGFFFVHATASGRVEHAAGDHIDVEVAGTLAPAEPAEYYDVVGETTESGAERKLRLKLPPSDVQLTAGDVPALVARAIDTLLSPQMAYKTADGDVGLLDGLSRSQALVDADAVFGVLNTSTVSAGAFKSLLQKVIRFGAAKTRLPDGQLVDSRVVTMVTIAFLNSIKSSFVPDLGTHVRGPTAAFKRLGVIMVEDAWPQSGMLRGLGAIDARAKQNPARALSALMGVAIATTRLADWTPPESTVIASMAVAVACQQSAHIADWRSAMNKQPLSVELARVGPADTARVDVAMAGRILRIIRAFAGDMDMFDKHLVNMLTPEGKVAVRSNPNEPVGVMPLVHLIDFHVYKGTAFCTALGAVHFKDRHRAIFDKVTGTNPRLVNGTLIDEAHPTVTIVRQQQRMISSVLFPPPVDVSMDPHPTAVVQLPVDFGVLSAGVGPIGPITVRTTGAQNLADGDPRNSATSWTVLVIIGVEDAEDVVIYNPSVRDGDKKPKITATAKRLAIAEARKSERRFNSPVLRAYSKARYQDGAWTLFSSSGAPPLVWSWTTPKTVAIEHAQIPAFAEPFDLANVDQMRRLIDERGVFATSPSLSVDYEAAIAQVLTDLSAKATAQGLSPQILKLRLLSTIRNQYDSVAMALPANDGGLGADQLLAVDGDWLVYLSLLCISRVAPGALQPKLPPNFNVPDARLLRVVEKAIADLIVASPRTDFAAPFSTALSTLEARYGTPAIENREPFLYQTALVEKMIDRDRNAVVKPRGHFVNLDTGLGKSFVAALYVLKYGAEFGTVKRVVWFTPKNVAPTALTELAKTWGFGPGAVGIVDSKAPSFGRLINIVKIDDLSHATKGREGLEKALARIAETSFAVVDEVHLLYNAALKTSTIRRFVEASPKFVCLTATPTPSRGQFVGEKWLADCVGFPLTKMNFLVAAAMTIAARIELPIEAHEVLVPITLPLDVATQHAQYLRTSSQNWEAAARLVRRAVIPAMAAKAVELADADRATHPSGGVLVFLDNSAEVDEFLGIVTPLLEGKGYGAGKREKRESNGNLGIVATTKTDVAGFNFVSAGAIVTSVFAQSAASRHQMRGRIRRLGQVRSEVTYATVYPLGTIIELLLKRHSLVDAKNASLEALAKEWAR